MTSGDEIEFNRPALVAELQRSAAAAPVGPNGYLRQELLIAAESLRTINEASGDRLGRLYRLRLLSEIAIRIRWVAGDEDVSDAFGRPRADRELAISRIAMILKRDTLRLAHAQAAIHEVRGTVPAEAAELQRQIDAISERAAPSDPKDMIASPAAASAYAAYRMASALIHPGLGIGRAELMPDDRLGSMADDAAYLIATYGDALVRALSSPEPTGS
jgi:hypothetical protein